MKFILLAVIICITVSCMQTKSVQLGFSKKHKIEESRISNVPYSSVVDFRVQRLSGSRVQLSWHAIAGKQKLPFQVMRKIGTDGSYSPVSMIEPGESTQEGLVDYVLTDLNNSSDSSFYAILQVDEKGAKYFSAPKGVEGKR